MFGVCGSFFIASGVVVLPILCVSRRIAKRVEDNQTENDNHNNGHSMLSVNNNRPRSMLGSRLSINKATGSSYSINKLSDQR